MSTFLELQNEVLAHGFDAAKYRARVKTWLNYAQSRIARKLELADLFATQTVTTAAGVSTYTMPANFIRVTGVTLGADGDRLDFVDDADRLVAQNQAGQNTGTPMEFSVQGEQFIFSPVPDGAYVLTVSYYGRPADMVNDSDVSVLSADYHDLMVSWSLARAYRSEDDAEMSNFYRNEYLTDLRDMGNDLQQQVHDSPKQVPGMWTSGE